MTENELLNQVLEKHLKRKPTDADAKRVTRYFPLGYEKKNYQVFFDNIFLGTMHKQLLFGKEKLKFVYAKRA